MRSTFGEQLLCSFRFQRHTHLVALGAQEVLEQLRGIPVALRERAPRS